MNFFSLRVGATMNRMGWKSFSRLKTLPGPKKTYKKSNFRLPGTEFQSLKVEFCPILTKNFPRALQKFRIKINSICFLITVPEKLSHRPFMMESGFLLKNLEKNRNCQKKYRFPDEKKFQNGLQSSLNRFLSNIQMQTTV